MTASAFSRSAISNSRRLHADRNIDGRSAAGRRFRDLTLSLADSLGGFASLREGERAMVRSAAALMLRLEQQQAALAAGQEADPDLLIRLNSEARRALEALRRREERVTERDAVTDLKAYAASIEGRDP